LLDISRTPLPLGRLASRIALTLMGKHKPIYDPSTDCGDYIVATNCSLVRVTGKKLQQKLYYSHTTRPGSLKSISMERMMDKWGGGEVLRRAVRGMLPKNRLRDIRLGRLKSEFLVFGNRLDVKCGFANSRTAFEGPAHPHKHNVLKYPGQTVLSITDLPEVKSRIAPLSTAESVAPGP
jgi:large subunit ribosomal protein L13